jgi:hypothetical protein
MIGAIMLLVLILASFYSVRKQYENSIEEIRREQTRQEEPVGNVTSSVHIYTKDELDRVFGKPVQYVEPEVVKETTPYYRPKPKPQFNGTFDEWVENCRKVDEVFRATGRLKPVS